MKKIIGIVGKPKKGNIWNKMFISDELRYLVVKSGGLAVSILPTEETMEFNDNDFGDRKHLNPIEKEDLYELINLCDGIILQGGMTSSSYEVECAKKTLELDKPLLGICAGFNNILRALGGEVVLDKTNKHNYLDTDFRHLIKIEKDSKLFEIIQEESIKVNSIHSMIAKSDEVRKFAKISSYSEDGFVESFEVPSKKFAMAIKWHPELMLNEYYVDKLFKEFISKC